MVRSSKPHKRLAEHSPDSGQRIVEFTAGVTEDDNSWPVAGIEPIRTSGRCWPFAPVGRRGRNDRRRDIAAICGISLTGSHSANTPVQRRTIQDAQKVGVFGRIR